jgi:hypothetical protein
METLTAYVREHAPWPPRQALANPFVELQGSSERADERTPAEQPENAAEPRPATDIQAILTIFRRRDETTCQQDEAAGRHLDLADLRGANLASRVAKHNSRL